MRPLIKDTLLEYVAQGDQSLRGKVGRAVKRPFQWFFGMPSGPKTLADASRKRDLQQAKWDRATDTIRRRGSLVTSLDGMTNARRGDTK